MFPPLISYSVLHLLRRWHRASSRPPGPSLAGGSQDRGACWPLNKMKSECIHRDRCGPHLPPQLKLKAFQGRRKRSCTASDLNIKTYSSNVKPTKRKVSKRLSSPHQPERRAKRCALMCLCRTCLSRTRTGRGPCFPSALPFGYAVVSQAPPVHNTSH